MALSTLKKKPILVYGSTPQISIMADMEGKYDLPLVSLWLVIALGDCRWSKTSSSSTSSSLDICFDLFLCFLHGIFPFILTILYGEIILQNNNWKEQQLTIIVQQGPKVRSSNDYWSGWTVGKKRRKNYKLTLYFFYSSPLLSQVKSSIFCNKWSRVMATNSLEFAFEDKDNRLYTIQ